MMQLVRTDSTHPDFNTLVRDLDRVLAELDGEEHAFYARFNKVDAIREVVMIYEDGLPVACGAIKPFDPGTMEIKRMYTIPSHRGKGYASKILDELEKWARELQYKRCILETGKRQPDAIGLYRKKGYRQIPNYGQYARMENSVCFEKILNKDLLSIF